MGNILRTQNERGLENPARLNRNKGGMGNILRTQNKLGLENLACLVPNTRTLENCSWGGALGRRAPVDRNRDKDGKGGAPPVPTAPEGCWGHKGGDGTETVWAGRGWGTT